MCQKQKNGFRWKKNFSLNFFMMVQTKIPTLKISVNPDKLNQAEFYHIIFADGPKKKLEDLPLPIQINGEEFFLVDFAYSGLFELPNELIQLSHGMWQTGYMSRMIEKYPSRFKAETVMMICKFSKQPNL